jgi:coenzyme PQQ precursor peptide PqqA
MTAPLAFDRAAPEIRLSGKPCAAPRPGLVLFWSSPPVSIPQARGSARATLSASRVNPRERARFLRGTRLADTARVRTKRTWRPHPAVPSPKETLMQWTQPAFEDMRFGFEITMYIASR